MKRSEMERVIENAICKCYVRQPTRGKMYELVYNILGEIEKAGMLPPLQHPEEACPYTGLNEWEPEDKVEGEDRRSE